MLGDVAESRQRRAQIVRDVVERAAHAAEQRLDALEHDVDLPAERVERIAAEASPSTRASKRPVWTMARTVASSERSGARPA